MPGHEWWCPKQHDGVVGGDELCGFEAYETLLLRVEHLFLADRPVVGERINDYRFAVTAVKLTFLFQFRKVFPDSD